MSKQLKKELENLLDMYALHIADDEDEFSEELKADQDTVLEAIESLFHKYASEREAKRCRFCLSAKRLRDICPACGEDYRAEQRERLNKLGGKDE